MISLQITIDEFLVSFADICGLSIGVLHGGTWGKLRATTRNSSFSGDDTGVGAELAKFQSPVSKRITVVDTLTLESVRGNKRKLSQAAWHLENLRLRAGRNPNRIGRDQKGH